MKKNIYLKPKSSGKINFSNNEENRENHKKRMKKESINNINSFYPCHTSNCDTSCKESTKKKNFGYKKKNNSVIYLNITNFRNINPINPILVNTTNTEGSERKYEPILSEENDINEINDFNLDEKILDTKIKSLEKERDFVLKNIINKYQDKIAKISQEKNNLLLKHSLRNDNFNLKNYKNQNKRYSTTLTNTFGIKAIKNRFDYSLSNSTSNK